MRLALIEARGDEGTGGVLGKASMISAGSVKIRRQKSDTSRMYQFKGPGRWDMLTHWETPRLGGLVNCNQWMEP